MKTFFKAALIATFALPLLGTAQNQVTTPVTPNPLPVAPATQATPTVGNPSPASTPAASTDTKANKTSEKKHHKKGKKSKHNPQKAAE